MVVKWQPNENMTTKIIKKYIITYVLLSPNLHRQDDNIMSRYNGFLPDKSHITFMCITVTYSLQSFHIITI